MLERFHISFKAALIILILQLLFIPALVILPWMGHFHYNALKNIAVESGFLQNKWLLETVESEIKESVEYAGKKSISLASALAKEPIDFQALNEYLKEAINSRTGIESLYLIDSKQKFLAGLDSKNLKSNASDPGKLFPSYYSDSLQQQVLGLISSGQNTQNIEPVVFHENNRIIILVPVFHETNLSGILIANINTSFLWSLINDHIQSGKSGSYVSNYYIVNKSGQVSSAIFKPVKIEEQNEAHNLTFNALYEQSDKKISSANGPFLIESIQTLFLVSALAAPSGSGFALVAEIPTGSIVFKSSGIIYPAIAALLLLVFLVLIFGLVVLPFIFKPLESLKEAFEKLSRNNTPGDQLISQLGHSPISDFNELIEKFSHMFSARLEVEKKLRENEQNLTLTLQSIGDAVIVTDALGFITKMNKVAEDITGWQEAEALRQPLSKVFHIINSETRNIAENPVEKVIRSGSIVGLANHTALISKKGEEYQIADSAAPIIEDGVTYGVILVFHDVTDEYSLRQSEKDSWDFLNGLVNDMETMVAAIELDGTLTFVNNTAINAAGISEKDVIGKKLWDTFWFNGLDESQQTLKETINKAAAGNATTIVTTVNILDIQIWIELSIHPVYDHEGKVKYLVPEGRNVTERVLAEKTLEENRRQTDSILDNASAFIYIKDFGYRYLTANKSISDLYGIKHGDLIGRNDAEILNLPPSVTPSWDKNFEKVLKEKRQIEFEETATINGIRHTFISTKFLLYDSSGQPYAFCGISTDISQRVEFEKRLRDSELRLRQHREQTPIGFIECNDEFEIIDWNPGATRIFGFSKEEALGKKVADLVIPEEYQDEFDFNCVTVAAAKESTQHLYVNTNKSGDTLYCDWYCAPMFNEDGNFVAVTSEVVDITSQKLQEDQLRRSQKMDALGKLTGGIAHDFNNILGVVIGYTEMIEASDSLDESLKKYLKEVKSAGQRGARLTNKLLAFSRQKHAHTEIICINDLLLEDKNMLEKVLTARIKLVFDLEQDLWPVLIDKSDFEDAILNMSINALNAIDGNGQISFIASNIFLDQDTAEYYELSAGDYVKIEIIDSGCGIPKEIISRIFEPFFTTNDISGNGLGLSQVYGFVQRSGGAIHVESELEKGSHFTLLFPRTDHQANVDEGLSNTDTLFEISAGSENLGILVVDDEPALRDLAKEILSMHGFNVICANNGSHAMDMLKSNKVSLIISDVIMPIMDGYQLVDQVQKKYPEIKILLTSGFTDRRTLDQKDEEKKRKLLYKPYTSVELLRRVSALLYKNNAN